MSEQVAILNKRMAYRGKFLSFTFRVEGRNDAIIKNKIISFLYKSGYGKTMHPSDRIEEICPPLEGAQEINDYNLPYDGQD